VIILLSNFAFNFNLRRFIMAVMEEPPPGAAPEGAGDTGAALGAAGGTGAAPEEAGGTGAVGDVGGVEATSGAGAAPVAAGAGLTGGAAVVTARPHTFSLFCLTGCRFVPEVTSIYMYGQCD